MKFPPPPDGTDIWSAHGLQKLASSYLTRCDLREMCRLTEDYVEGLENCWMHGEKPVCRKSRDSVYGAWSLHTLAASYGILFIQWTSRQQHSKIPSADVFGQFDANWIGHQGGNQG